MKLRRVYHGGRRYAAFARDVFAFFFAGREIGSG
jgi:hypothetical protein